MKNLKLLSFAIMSVVLSLGIMGCKKEAGPTGPAGANGQDGNADVKTLIFNNPDWSSGTSRMDLNTSFTDEQITNDVILTYIQLSTSSNYMMSVPGNNGSFYFHTYFFNSTTGTPSLAGDCRLFCSDLFGVLTPNVSLPQVNFVKFIVIKSSGTSYESGNGMIQNGNGMIQNGKETILSDLQKANVDVNNYEEVCAYYGVVAE